MNMGDGFLFTPEYDGVFGKSTVLARKYKSAQDTGNIQDTTKIFMENDLRLGFEKKMEGIWFFDHLTPRAGIVYKWVKRKATLEDSTGKKDVELPYVETNNDKFYQNRGLKLAAGFGFTKGRATVDVSADLLNWKSGSVITGPAAAMLTVTIDIAREPREGSESKDKGKSEEKSEDE
jgi:hypothetical protein